MKTRAAVLHEYNQPLAVEELDLESPKEKEVLPPRNKEEHLDTIYENRHSLKGKIRRRSIKTMIRVMTRFSK